MKTEPLKLVCMADLHYYSPTLGTTGSAYERRSSTDQKCLAESGGIIRSAFETVANSDCDAVLIAGDLTNDGETVSHKELMELLTDLQKKKPVYVVYATHDWCCSEDAARYEGDNVLEGVVETMTPPELREFYYDFGINGCISEYVHPNGSSSYCRRLKEGYRLLGLNDDKNGKGASGYTEEHLAWILRQIDDAEKAGETLICMQHHLLFPCVSELVNSGGQTIGDWKKQAEALASAGLEIIFVGHSHMQRTAKYTAENGNTLYEVNIGSLCGYPAPYMFLTVDEKQMRLDADTVKQFEYNGQSLHADDIKAHSLGVLKNLTDNADRGKEALAFQLKGYGIDFNQVKIPYGAIRFGVKHLKNDSVQKTARLLNCLTFGKAIDKKAAKKLGDIKLIDLVYRIYLSVLDPFENGIAPDSELYQVLCDVAALPNKVVHRLPFKALKTEKVQKITEQIEFSLKELVCPGINSRHSVIERQIKK